MTVLKTFLIVMDDFVELKRRKAIHTRYSSERDAEFNSLQVLCSGNGRGD